jgi:hypothetical protein
MKEGRMKEETQRMTIKRQRVHPSVSYVRGNNFFDEKEKGGKKRNNFCYLEFLNLQTQQTNETRVKLSNGKNYLS